MLCCSAPTSGSPCDVWYPSLHRRSPGCLALAAVTVPLTAAVDSLPRFLVIAIVAPVGSLVYMFTLRMGFPAAWADARTLAVQVLGPLGNRLSRGRGKPEGRGEGSEGTKPAEPAPAGVA